MLELLTDAIEHAGIATPRQPPLEMQREITEPLARDEIHRWPHRERAQHIVVQAPASLWKLRLGVAPPVRCGQFTLCHGVGFRFRKDSRRLQCPYPPIICAHAPCAIHLLVLSYFLEVCRAAEIAHLSQNPLLLPCHETRRPV